MYKWHEIPGTDNWKYYVTDQFDHHVEEFYANAVTQIKEQKSYLSKDSEKIYLKENLINAPAMYWAILYNGETSVSGWCVTKYDWMPDEWSRPWSRFLTTSQSTSGSSWVNARRQETNIIKGLTGIRYVMASQNITDTGEYTLDNYDKFFRKYERLYKYFQPEYPPAWFDFRSVVMLNKTPQVLFYSSYSGDKPSIEWLEEYAVHEN